MGQNEPKLVKMSQNWLKLAKKSEFWVKKDPKFKKKIPKKFWRFWPGFDINLTRDEYLGQKWLNYREKSRIFVKKRRRSQDLVCTEMRYSMFAVLFVFCTEQKTLSVNFPLKMA